MQRISLEYLPYGLPMYMILKSKNQCYSSHLQWTNQADINHFIYLICNSLIHCCTKFLHSDKARIASQQHNVTDMRIQSAVQAQKIRCLFCRRVDRSYLVSDPKEKYKARVSLFPEQHALYSTRMFDKRYSLKW